MRLKSVLLVSAIVCMYQSAIAQKPKNFRINGGVQYNMPEKLFNAKLPSYNKKNEGAAFHIQPRLILNKHFTVGLNLEYAMVTEGAMMLDNQVVDAISVFDILSVVPTANYYFTTTRFKPFVSLGLGTFHSLHHKPALLFGGKASAGLNVSDVFELSLEYSKIGTKIDFNPNAMGDFGNYYVGIKGSFSVGIFNWQKFK